MAEIPIGNKIRRLCIFFRGGKGGGGQTRCIFGDVQVANFFYFFFGGGGGGGGGGKQGVFLEMCKWRIVFIAKTQIQV